jgi:tetratricopeptide (TPR) repeat protein
MGRVFVASVLLALMTLPVRAQADRQEAYCFDASGRLPVAERIAACDALAASKPFSDTYRARAYAWRGTIHQNANAPDAAMADYDEALKLDDGNLQARMARARIHLNRKDYDAALADVNAVIRKQPDASAPMMLRSAIHLAMKRYPDAIADADGKPGFGGPAVLRQRCWVRAVAGMELDAAKTACDQALWAAPAAAPPLDSRGLVFLKQKKFDLAWNDYNAAVKIAPRSASALYGRGIAAMALGRAAEGHVDIAAAQGLNGDIGATYAGYGVTP